MQKKDKFYILIFIFSIASICISIALKLFGFDWFQLNKYSIETLFNLEMFIELIILIFQYILIVGCITRYKFKELCIKMIPYIPLTTLLYFFPKDKYSILCVLILFVTCIALLPKFSTIVNFIINIIFISILQLIIIWLKLDITNVMPVFPNTINFFVMNIDQFIILIFLYYINRKRGEK